jgi:hypothetical protein
MQRGPARIGFLPEMSLAVAWHAMVAEDRDHMCFPCHEKVQQTQVKEHRKIGRRKKKFFLWKKSRLRGKLQDTNRPKLFDEECEVGPMM